MCASASLCPLTTSRDDSLELLDIRTDTSINGRPGNMRNTRHADRLCTGGLDMLTC